MRDKGTDDNPFIDKLPVDIVNDLGYSISNGFNWVGNITELVLVAVTVIGVNEVNNDGDDKEPVIGGNSERGINGIPFTGMPLDGITDLREEVK